MSTVNRNNKFNAHYSIGAYEGFPMIKFGQVVERNDGKGLVTVRFERPEACTKCGACGSGSQKGEVTVLADCKVGEWVRVELPEGRFLQATALVYVIPLAGLLLGLFLGLKLGAGSDLWAVLGAALGIVVALLALYGIDKNISKKPEWRPKITAVYPEKPSLEDLGCGIS
jgi:sigma-E factor negative regulatory protein RseC